jgi:hypothetical protein
MGGHVEKKHELGLTNFLKKSDLHLPYIKRKACVGGWFTGTACVLYARTHAHTLPHTVMHAQTPH